MLTLFPLPQFPLPQKPESLTIHPVLKLIKKQKRAKIVVDAMG
jgi:hypothetical protein